MERRTLLQALAVAPFAPALPPPQKVEKFAYMAWLALHNREGILLPHYEGSSPDPGAKWAISTRAVQRLRGLLRIRPNITDFTLLFKGVQEEGLGFRKIKIQGQDLSPIFFEVVQGDPLLVEQLDAAYRDPDYSVITKREPVWLKTVRIVFDES